MMLTVTDLVRIAAQIWGVSPDDIISRSRKHCYLHPRQAVMAVANEQGTSLNRIGRRLGFTHVTVGHGVRVSADREGTPSDYTDRIARLRSHASSQRHHP